MSHDYNNDIVLEYLKKYKKTVPSDVKETAIELYILLEKICQDVEKKRNNCEKKESELFENLSCIGKIWIQDVMKLTYYKKMNWSTEALCIILIYL